MELIPGIPDDLARECLVRADYNQLPTVISVCKSWSSEVQQPAFRRLRKAASSSKTLIVMAQLRMLQTQRDASHKERLHPLYRFSVLDPGSGQWNQIPPIVIDSVAAEVPLFCQIVSVGSDLLVIGGVDPLTWQVSRAVMIFSFLTGKWRRGSDMPGLRRSFFGCAADPDARMVYVAGGHDEEKNALRTAMVYDMARDEWAELPDMACERDECKAVFGCGQIHVIGGYRTEMQGKFQRGAEVLDVATRMWESPNENYLDFDACPRTCSRGGEDETLYMCHDGHVVAKTGTRWQSVCTLPDGVATTTLMSSWRGKLIVIGSAKFGDPQVAHMLDLGSRRWTVLVTPAEFSGHVQCGCLVEI